MVFSNRGLLKPELLATILFRLLPSRRRLRVVVYGDLWQPSFGAQALVERAAVRLLVPAVARYVCSTRSAAELVQEFWRISPSKLTVLPYYFDWRSMVDLAASSDDGYVFSGGSTARDFGPVLQRARERPDVQFVINTTRLGKGDVPRNVELMSERTDGYVKLMERAAVVLLPLRTDYRRGTGTLTLLLAASLKKPIIVTPAFGVAEYLTDGEHALFVDGSVEQYGAALDHVADLMHASEVAAMVERAHQHVTKHFTLACHLDGLLRVVDEAAEMHSLTEVRLGSGTSTALRRHKRGLSDSCGAAQAARLRFDQFFSSIRSRHPPSGAAGSGTTGSGTVARSSTNS